MNQIKPVLWGSSVWWGKKIYKSGIPYNLTNTESCAKMLGEQKKRSTLGRRAVGKGFTAQVISQGSNTVFQEDLEGEECAPGRSNTWVWRSEKARCWRRSSQPLLFYLCFKFSTNQGRQTLTLSFPLKEKHCLCVMTRARVVWGYAWSTHLVCCRGQGQREKIGSPFGVFLCWCPYGRIKEFLKNL